MADSARSRLAIDLDHIERQLNYAAREPAPPQKDPLAELARIVGQDDPFRVLLEQQPARGEPLRPAREPAQAAVAPAYPAADWSDGYASAPDHAYALRPSVSAADEHHPQHDPAPHGEDPYGVPHDPEPAYDPPNDQAYADADRAPYPEHTAPYLGPPRQRRGLIAVGAALGVVVLGAGGMFVFRGAGSHTATGEAPVVKADASPTKVAPQNPGGVEIPDQNKQIYERSGQDAQTRVVTREEQPVDVRQAARLASAGGGGPLPGAAGIGAAAAPGNASVNATLGEPKRVRTLAVGPDGTLKVAGADPQSGATSATPSAQPAGSALPPQRPRSAASTTPQAAPAPAKPPAAASGDAGANAQPKASRSAGLQASPTAAEPTQTSAAAADGHVVQLAVRPSEKEAKAAFQQLQQKFSGELTGRTAAIRRAEVNGSTVYRVRVGPMSREEASSLCERLKSAGGQCFVAKN
jgi:hypothetical protein